MEIEMPAEQVEPDSYTFTQLMTISRNFEIAIGLFQIMCKKNILLNDYTYRKLLALAGKDEDKQKRFKELWDNCQQKL